MKFYLFDRTDKIINFDDLTVLTSERFIKDKFSFTMSQNEVYVLQLAVLSESDDVIKDIKYESDKLSISCINVDVTNKWGEKSKQEVKLYKNSIRPLFFTVQVEEKGLEKQEIKFDIICESKSYTLKADVKINDMRVYNHGYNDLWRLSRLKWLNSTLMQDETLVKPFVSPKICGNEVEILGRKIKIEKSGLIGQVYSYFDEAVQIESDVQKALFSKPAEFKIGEEVVKSDKADIKAYNNRAEILSVGENERCKTIVAATLRYDGQITYSLQIIPKCDFEVDNAGLNLYINPDCALLMHGLGHRASKAENLSFKWDEDKQQDCIFIGTVNCGIRAKFKAENYRRPLINIFYKNLPLIIPKTTWDNNSNGDIKVEVLDDFVKLSAETNKYEFKKNEARRFDFEFHITPFKPIDYKKAFGVRYLHNSHLKNEYKDIDEASKKGLNYVTFHQGNMIMPYINYPFYEVDRLKKAVQYADSKGIGIKLYYTEREHSNHMAETFVYKALDDEIVLRKKGVSHSWQKEKPQWLVDNFGEDIIPGWFVKYKKGKYKGEHDISFIVRPDTRLDNYYVEGLNWLVENIGIKGIYIDDTSLDRTTIERSRKVLDKVDGLIDMHMWNHEEVRAGDVSCLNLYCELLPFLDSIWLGEGFFYKRYSPEYMLCEVSGIPYGVTGQMLQDGGDLYEGIIYAMNNRYGWGYKNAADMYKLWDDFKIEESKMLGYWHSKNPIKTDNENVLTTVYLKGDCALLCIYNFSSKREKFKLDINRELLGFDINKAENIKFGSNIKKSVDVNAEFTLMARKGKIIFVGK